MEISDCFKIGYVAKPHGLKGEVTVSVGNDCPDLNQLQSFFLEINGQLVPYFIESVSVRGAKAFIKLEDIQSPEQASSLKGCSLYLSKEMRPRLGRGEFYNDEVIDFEVIDDELGNVGRVTGVMETGVSKHLLIDRGGKELMIPLNSPFIRSVNKSRKRIAVNLPEGYLDI